MKMRNVLACTLIGAVTASFFTGCGTASDISQGASSANESTSEIVSGSESAQSPVTKEVNGFVIENGQIVSFDGDLENVVLPPEAMNEGAWSRCEGLDQFRPQSITLPANATSDNLKNLPTTVFSEDNSCFLFSLENSYVDESCAEFKSIDGVLFSKDGKELIIYPGGRKQKEYAVPEGTEIIKNGE